MMTNPRLRYEKLNERFGFPKQENNDLMKELYDAVQMYNT
jgi:hypothetical protein